MEDSDPWPSPGAEPGSPKKGIGQPFGIPMLILLPVPGRGTHEILRKSGVMDFVGRWTNVERGWKMLKILKMLKDVETSKNQYFDWCLQTCLMFLLCLGESRKKMTFFNDTDQASKSGISSSTGAANIVVLRGYQAWQQIPNLWYPTNSIQGK